MRFHYNSDVPQSALMKRLTMTETDSFRVLSVYGCERFVSLEDARQACQSRWFECSVSADGAETGYHLVSWDGLDVARIAEPGAILDERHDVYGKLPKLFRRESE